MIVNHKKNMIKAYFNEMEQKNFTMTFLEEESFLGTGGGIALLKEHMNSTFILSNCDILISADFSSIYEQHKKEQNLITMICAEKNFQVPYGVIHLGEEQDLQEIEEKPTFSFLTNTGCYFVEPTVITSIQEGEVIGFPDIITRLQKQGQRVGVYSITEDAWLDMGQLEEMEKMGKRLGF